MKVELGKWYKERGGVIVGPIESNQDPLSGGVFPFTGLDINGERATYTTSGAFSFNGDSKYDLVEEFVPPGPGGAAQTSDDYAPLSAVFQEALDQASAGKGKVRHAGGKPFLKQPIMEIGRMVGPAGHAYQCMKKAQEAVGMLKRGERDAAYAEVLGAINYLAAMAVLIKEQDQ